MMAWVLLDWKKLRGLREKCQGICCWFCEKKVFRSKGLILFTPTKGEGERDK